MSAELEGRLAALEQRLYVQERLSRGVERLGDETAGLHAVLAKVDEQQQRLSSLGQQLTDVEQKAVTKQQLAVKEAKDLERVKAERKARVQRYYAWGIGAMALLSVVALLAIQSQAERSQDQQEYRQAIYDVCEARAAQSRKVRELVENAPPAEDAQGEASRRLFLEAFPLVDCSELKP